LPYEYGTNQGQGTPLYRAVPSREDRTRLEPWLAQKPKASAEAEGSAAPPEQAASSEPDATAPWYMRDYDGGRPPVTLGDLKETGPVARRMMKGFYISLDKKFTSDNVTWWRAASGLIAPVSRVVPCKPRTDFHGVWLGPELDGGAQDAGADVKTPWIPPRPIAALPVGIVTSARAGRYAINEDKQQVAQPGVAPRFTIAGLTGKKAVIRGHTYWETDSDWWMGDNEVVIPEPGPPPEGLGPDEKWIDVNVTHQWLIALVGRRAVYVTLISSGKKNETDKDKDHRTVTGSFHIREKHISATMDDDSASDGPYSIEDVPWIMYFRRGYALHGAFWHDDFGHRRSHGCINLAPSDAKALFQWTDPALPKGWHAVFATEEHSGTRVVVHD
jgi:lipoprotein-anchoring transpeptidase ErfK/SrfK